MDGLRKELFEQLKEVVAVTSPDPKAVLASALQFAREDVKYNPEREDPIGPVGSTLAHNSFFQDVITLLSVFSQTERFNYRINTTVLLSLLVKGDLPSGMDLERSVWWEGRHALQPYIMFATWLIMMQRPHDLFELTREFVSTASVNDAICGLYYVIFLTHNARSRRPVFGITGTLDPNLMEDQLKELSCCINRRLLEKLSPAPAKTKPDDVFRLAFVAPDIVALATNTETKIFFDYAVTLLKMHNDIEIDIVAVGEFNAGGKNRTVGYPVYQPLDKEALLRNYNYDIPVELSDRIRVVKTPKEISNTSIIDALQFIIDAEYDCLVATTLLRWVSISALNEFIPVAYLPIQLGSYPVYPIDVACYYGDVSQKSPRDSIKDWFDVGQLLILPSSTDRVTNRRNDGSIQTNLITLGVDWDIRCPSGLETFVAGMVETLKVSSDTIWTCVGIKDFRLGQFLDTFPELAVFREKGQIDFIAYANPMINVAAKGDICVVPPMSGGGRATVMCLSLGQPAVCYHNNDARPYLGAEFVASDDKSYFEALTKLISDVDLRAVVGAQNKKRFQRAVASSAENLVDACRVAVANRYL